MKLFTYFEIFTSNRAKVWKREKNNSLVSIKPLYNFKGFSSIDNVLKSCKKNKLELAPSSSRYNPRRSTRKLRKEESSLPG